MLVNHVNGKCQMKTEDIVILVVGDERNHVDGIVESLEKFGAKMIAVYNGKDALEIIRSEKVNIIITNLNLEGDIDGLEVLKQAKNQNVETEVILITAYATIDTCKDVIKEGAYDYLVKPIDIDQLCAVVEQISRKFIAWAIDSVWTAGTGKDRFIFEGIHGKGSVMAGIFKVLRRVSPTDISVLIEGQSGTGKELLAWTIHHNSKRRDKPFRPMNCAGLTETLLESELFGHAKGAFTGASTDRKGLFEIADKGTLFLDEIGDMPLNMQAKLLRVLENGVVVPVGTHKPIVVDVRIISATNHDLRKLIEEKKFREDLFFRIKGVSLCLPSLQERAEDIPVLVDCFLKEAIEEIGSNVCGITQSALGILSNFAWPGNIRQLKNCIRTMVAMCDGETLDVQDVPAEIHQVRRLGAGLGTNW